MLGKLIKSKVTTHKIITGMSRDNKMPTTFGTNKNTFSIPFKSGTKAATGPTK